MLRNNRILKKHGKLFSRPHFFARMQPKARDFFSAERIRGEREINKRVAKKTQAQVV